MWRFVESIGRVPIYENDLKVATAYLVEDAARIVAAMNAAEAEAEVVAIRNRVTKAQASFCIHHGTHHCTMCPPKAAESARKAVCGTCGGSGLASYPDVLCDACNGSGE